MRKLVSVQVVAEVEPIPGADRIEKIRVLGWSLVSKKGEFKVGDLCAYFEVDSFLPDIPEYDFLRASSYRVLNEVGGFRLRTIKLRGQVSQGLAVPYRGNLPIGTDLTEAYDVVKWDPPLPACLAGKVKGYFPGFLTKTDEERIQANPDLLQIMAGRSYYISTKLDGSSGTFYAHQGNFGVCGRTLEFEETPDNSFWQIARRYGLEEKLLANGDICIQGELCGPGIQKNPLKLSQIDFFVFNAYHPSTMEHLSLDDMLILCEDLGLRTVHIEEVGACFSYSTVRELLERAEGTYVSGVEKEGIVIRATDKPRCSFKVINNRFLLSED